MRGQGGVAGSQRMSTAVHRSPNKLWRSKSIFHLYRKLETNIPEKEFSGHSPNFHIHVFLSDLYIPTIDLPILLQEICMWTDPGNI
jgi:hypothetical protein